MLITNPSNTFVFSDPHFDHTNIIKYCRRPFRDVGAMNRRLIRNYNRVIKNNSLVFFLGDMAFGKSSKPACYWRKRLKGHIIYIKGSHDIGMRGRNHAIVNCNDVQLYLVHDPSYVNDWPGWIVHGHVHNKCPFVDYRKRRINASVDVTHFYPVRLSYILKKV